MKRLCILAMSFLTISLIIVRATEAQANGIQYLGEVCFRIEGTDTQGTARIFRFGVTLIGGQHYLFTGRGDGATEVASGNGELIGDKIYLTLTWSGGDDNYTWTFIGRGILNAVTYDGTLEIMGVSHTKTPLNPEEAHLDYDGPFSFNVVRCPGD